MIQWSCHRLAPKNCKFPPNFRRWRELTDDTERRGIFYYSNGTARLGLARTGKARRGKALRGKENKMVDIKISKPTDIINRRVRLCGLAPIMFDRYAGDNKTKLEVHQKLYFRPGSSRVIGLPAINIMSFLSAHNTNSAPKRLRDSRQYKKIANACLSFVTIGPDFIPFLRDGNEVTFGQFEDDIDQTSGIYVHRAVARLEKGIPNPKERPVLPLPWALEFDFQLVPNREIKEQEIVNLIEEGGRAIGLGTFRGVFGKFYIDAWD